MTSSPGRFLHIYCDESRQQAHRYMVLGGVALDRNFEPEFLRIVQAYRDANRMHSELKWQKVSTGKLAEYKRFVDLLFEHRSDIHFKALVIDTHQMDNQKYNKGSKELGFYKMMYQLLLHSFGRTLRLNDRCLVTLDQRTTQRYKLSTFCRILNNGLRKRYGFDSDPVRHVQAMNSADSDLIQLADVLMGAVGYQANNDDQRVGASPAKVALARYIAYRANLVHLKQSTPKVSLHFSLWYFQFSRR